MKPRPSSGEKSTKKHTMKKWLLDINVTGEQKNKIVFAKRNQLLKKMQEIRGAGFSFSLACSL